MILYSTLNKSYLILFLIYINWILTHHSILVNFFQQFPAYTHFKCFSATAFSRYIFSTSVAALSVILYLGKNLVTWRGMSGLMEAIHCASCSISSSESFSPGTMRVVSSTWQLPAARSMKCFTVSRSPPSFL